MPRFKPLCVPSLLARPHPQLLRYSVFTTEQPEGWFVVVVFCFVVVVLAAAEMR